MDDVELKRLVGYDDRAEYELDLRGLSLHHATESVKRMVERSRFRAPRSVIVRLDPAGPDSGETLFLPIGRLLLAFRRKRVLGKLSPLPPHAGCGYYLVTRGKDR
ncbi:MAG: hypothetical protein COW30_07985 [Rhodospirillales bacterium CG15_BIG_FIL_POST_REV_8_21_14_020_66_15]|nr:MAG: hypothetical protein COW30_07985 [Rhodospirillales bacterium CG15_BIG_FIL_POST_REV_8_21_14_020_66_15]